MGLKSLWKIQGRPTNIGRHMSGGAGEAGGGSRGGGFFQRLTAFLAGAGLSLGLSYNIIWTELKEANDKLYSSFQNMESRLKALENSKK